MAYKAEPNAAELPDKLVGNTVPVLTFGVPVG